MSGPDATVTAREIFGPALDRAERYASILADAGVRRGLLGPREVDRLWDRHLENCAVVSTAFAPEASICDVGSGAGLPGLVVAILRPDLEITLLDTRERRAMFLEETAAALGLEQVRVVWGRAEEHSGVYDDVVARAVAPLGALLDLAFDLVRPGGSLLAMKGAKAAEELAAVEGSLPRRGVGSWGIERYGVGVVEPPATVVRLTRANEPDAGLQTPSHTGNNLES